MTVPCVARVVATVEWNALGTSDVKSRSTLEHLARALKLVVGDQLKRSFNGQEIWRDDHTWREIAGLLSKVLSRNVVLVDAKEYRELVAEANQMKLVRGYVEEYQRRLPKEKQAEKIRNPYARWAAENMSKEDEK